MNKTALDAIARSAIARVDPVSMVRDSVAIEGNRLLVTVGGGEISIDLSAYRRIVALGAGKASAAMAKGLEAVLGDRIDGGLIAVKYGHTAELEYIDLIEAGHPVPDERSVEAAKRIARYAEEAGEDTLCIALISGGGSALLTLPSQDGPTPLGLEDIQGTTSLLLGAGAPIQEINTVRKHLSGISGGRFCRMVHPGRLVALALSDVVGDDLSSIASGLAAPDPSSFGDTADICRRYGILASLSAPVRSLIEAGVRGEVPETPKPHDPIFDRVDAVVIGSNALALGAARRRAEDLGYNTLELTSQLTGEAREMAHLFTALSRDIKRGAGPVAAPACILTGGETTVTLRGDGKGGRNQEMALAVLDEMAAAPDSYDGVSFVSVGTDGNDGPTDAAGAFAATTLLAGDDSAARISDALDRNDAYTFFESCGGLYITGPTNTNVCDIQILLIE